MIKNTKDLILSWNNKAWDQYTSYLYIDRKYIKRINKLIKSIKRSGYRKGLGEPEPLRQVKAIKGTEIWLRRITHGYRLVYDVKPPYFQILSCKYHY